MRDTFLAIWSVTDIKIMDLDEDKEILKMSNVASVNNQVTSMCFTIRKGYLIVGLNQGQICVYRFDSAKHLINELEGHTKKVMDLRLTKADSHIISCS